MVGVLELFGDTLFDTAVVLMPHGAPVAYRKSHLYPPETAVFAAGDELVTVSTPVGLLGPLICFEHAFPEVAATLALAGAQVLAIPSAVPVGYEHLLHVRNRGSCPGQPTVRCRLQRHRARLLWRVDDRGARRRRARPCRRRPDELVARVDLTTIEAERRREPALGLRREPPLSTDPPPAVNPPPWPASGWPKPVDVGTGACTASFWRDGRWLSLGAMHPRHGYVELSNAPDFDEAHRGDPAHVRRYRAVLAEPSSAFLVADPTADGAGATLHIDRSGPQLVEP